MISLMQKYLIIRLKKEGISTNKIADDYGSGRNTIKKVWDDYCAAEAQLLASDPTVDTRKVIESLIEDPYYDVSNRRPLKYTQEIDEALRRILIDEETKTELLGKNHKQKLTKTQIYQLIADQGFDIGKSTIFKRINEIRDEHKEVFIRQEYEYGDRFEYDFGEIKMIINGRQTKGYLAVITLPASNFRWAYLYHNSKLPVFIDSHVKFFELVGGSFNEGVYDNMRNVVTRFIGKNEKELNKELIKLALYYDFKINVTNTFSGNEKGSVEGAVKWVRNKVFAVKYSFDSFEEACDYLQEELYKLNKDSFIEEEKKHLKAYRPKYEAAKIENYHVDKYSFIHVDGNSYSVPEQLCDKWVTVKLYPNELDVIYKNTDVAHHIRLDGKGKTHVEIEHYLHTFLKKPGALKNSAALKEKPDLKDIFDRYYTENPKLFIDILRENIGIDEKALLEKLIPVENSEIKTTDKVAEKTKRQIDMISELFVGGNNKYVN